MKPRHLEPSETAIKKMVRQFLALKHIFNFPITQGLGSYPGIPDRILFYQNRVIFLEIKRLGKPLSAAQMDFRYECLLNGIDHWVIHSVEELEEKLKLNGG